MGRPPMIPPEKKTRIVLAILAGEMPIAEVAREGEGFRAVAWPVEGGVHRGRQDRTGGVSVGAVKPALSTRTRPEG
jgi:hypothetical protein